MISIHIAEIKDAELIADLSRKTFYETFATQNTREDMEKFMNEQFTKTELMKEVGAPGNIFLLAKQGNEAVGYARMKESNNHEALENTNAIEIARLYVVNKAIGAGVGKILMQACIDKAIEMEKDVIWLGVWEKNTRAINFYTKWGFEKFHDHPFILGDDKQNDWLMKKNLQA